MTIQEIQVTAQIISTFAIAGGLVYTAFQFSRARKATHVANFTRMVELQMHLREMRVKDPMLAEVFRDDVADLTTDREVREYFFCLMQLSVYEIVWYAHRQGQLPEEYFESWARRMRVIAAEPAFRRMMSSPSMKIMHDDFQRYVQELVRTTPERSPLQSMSEAID
jgi:hypothetical protein